MLPLFIFAQRAMAADYVPISKDQRECDQSCLYKKANETLALQSIYALNKVRLLEAGDPSKISSELGGFCDQLNHEDPKDCLGRYRRFNLLKLQQARDATMINEDSASRLVSDDLRPLLANAQPKNAIVPVVPTLGDLETMLRDPKYKDSISRSYEADLEAINQTLQIPNQWEKAAPPKDTFLRMKIVARPSGEPLRFRETDPKQFDQKAFAATRAYLNQKGVSSQATGRERLENDRQVVAEMLASARQKHAAGQLNSPVQPNPRLAEPGNHQISQDAFHSARKAMLDAASRVAPRPLSPASMPRVAQTPGDAVNGNAPKAKVGPISPAPGSQSPASPKLATVAAPNQTSGARIPAAAGGLDPVKGQVKSPGSGPEQADVYDVFRTEDMQKAIEGVMGQDGQ